MSEALEFRASDAEREQTAMRLRDACTEGRLSVDELSDRVDAAYNARTMQELDALVSDLPRWVQPPPQSRHRPLMPGDRTFSEHFIASASCERVLNEALKSVAPTLARFGYAVLPHDGRSVTFERDRRPLWTILAAIFAFPIGLLALLHRSRTRIVLNATETDAGAAVTISGTAPLRIRRAFAQLSE